MLDEVGIEQLSTRRIAERLGVTQPALFWHFTSKRALLDALNEYLLQIGPVRRTPRPRESWQSFMRSSARDFRRTLLAHRDGARVHAGTRPRGADLEVAESQLRILIGAGLSSETALGACIALSRYVVGAVLEEQAAADELRQGAARVQRLDAFPLMRSARKSRLFAVPSKVDERAFEAGLALFVAGLEARMARPRKA